MSYTARGQTYTVTMDDDTVRTVSLVGAVPDHTHVTKSRRQDCIVYDVPLQRERRPFLVPKRPFYIDQNEKHKWKTSRMR